MNDYTTSNFNLSYYMYMHVDVFVSVYIKKWPIFESLIKLNKTSFPLG